MNCADPPKSGEIIKGPSITPTGTGPSSYNKGPSNNPTGAGPSGYNRQQMNCNSSHNSLGCTWVSHTCRYLWVPPVGNGGGVSDEL
ncbi:hypothetical protein M422DRAFT_275871 [Sphaerobolus stellatus SS14]|uniref:Uncharacterized protein n=1 Tax=Sphaerobolus stellatus (strain SS14) TaxID=990650 RepID=A0A0C9U380_SPHS4|nr:hypothetical protein M422DRAFT_275871 [Sphaerobolus stellatus SS14]